MAISEFEIKRCERELENLLSIIGDDDNCCFFG
jgi:hypothetical protein